MSSSNRWWPTMKCLVRSFNRTSASAFSNNVFDNIITDSTGDGHCASRDSDADIRNHHADFESVLNDGILILRDKKD